MNPTGERYYRAYQDAKPIFDEYQTWTDPLSKNLLRWQLQVILGFGSILRDTAITPEEKDKELLRVAKLCVEQLDKILVSPLNQAALVNPCFPREMEVFDFNKQTFVQIKPQLTWNFETLATYMTFLEKDTEVYIHRPDQKKIEVIDHLFAKKVLAWRSGWEVEKKRSEQTEIGAKLDALVASHEPSQETIGDFLRTASCCILSAAKTVEQQDTLRTRQEQQQKRKADRAAREERRRAEEAEEAARNQAHADFMEAGLNAHEEARRQAEAKIEEEIRQTKQETNEEQKQTAHLKKEAETAENEARNLRQETMETMAQNLERGRKDLEGWHQKRKDAEYGGIGLMQKLDGGSGGFCILL